MAAPQKLTALKAIKGILHEGKPLVVGDSLELETAEANYLIECGKVIPTKDFPAWAEKNKFKKN
jgi:hypothetical protein